MIFKNDSSTADIGNLTPEDHLQREVSRAVAVLRKGGIILYPTDTVWGIGCDAADSKAVDRIFRLKQREDAKSMLSLVDSVNSLEKCVSQIPEPALKMIEEADSPLTIIYDDPIGLARNLLAADGSAGIRVTREKFSHALCRAFGRPVVSTSANISGFPTPLFFDEISPEIKEGVDYIADYRRDDNGATGKSPAPSRIVKITAENILTVIR